MPIIKLHHLPIEVLSVIIQQLQIEDVYNLMLTCKTFMHLIINDNGVWKSICNTRLIIEEREKNKIAGQPWYDRCRISHNWCKARYKFRGLMYHDQNYMPWLKYHNSEALLLTKGSDLYCYAVDKNGFPNSHQCMWKLSMPKIKRYDKRTDDICRFVLKGNLLVCGNRNGSSAVYKIDNIYSQPQRIQYIENCQIDGYIDCSAEVSAVEIVNTSDNVNLVTGSTDSPIVLFWVWDTENDADLRETTNDAGISFGLELGGVSRETTKCLALNAVGDRLAIGPDGNSKPVLIDITSMEFLIKSEESANIHQIVQDIQWHDENTICYVTHSGSLQMMDVRTHQVIFDRRDPFDASFYCVRTDGSRTVVVGTNQHSRCVLYDTRQPRHTQIYFTQEKWKTSPVYCLDFDSSKLIAASARGVAALNFDVPASTPTRDFSVHFT